jgi:hypothetical protein
LSLEEEAALAFAGCGITGFALAELPYESGDVPEAGSGNILIHFIGRTVASGDAVHAVTHFVINDEGTWMLKRPQDYPRDEISGLAQVARERRLGLPGRARLPSQPRQRHDGGRKRVEGLLHPSAKKLRRPIFPVRSGASVSPC